MSSGPVYGGQLFVETVVCPVGKGITIDAAYMIIEVIDIYIVTQLCRLNTCKQQFISRDAARYLLKIGRHQEIIGEVVILGGIGPGIRRTVDTLSHISA